MRLSTSACIKLWNSTQERRPDPWEGRHACLTCPIGAANAGQTKEQAEAIRASESLRRICPRCHRRASRLINGLHCVSCYNRAREVARGKNAKGNLPVEVLASLGQSTVAFVVPGGSDATETFPSVMSLGEAILLATKRAGSRIEFGRARVTADLLSLKDVAA